MYCLAVILQDQVIRGDIDPDVVIDFRQAIKCVDQNLIAADRINIPGSDKIDCLGNQFAGLRIIRGCNPGNLRGATSRL